MAHGTSQVDQAAFSQENDVTAIGQGVTVHLWFHRITRGVLGQPSGVDFAIEMTDVADDGILEHVLEVTSLDDSGASGRRHEDASFLDGLIQRGHFESLHGSLEGVDGIDLGNENASAESSQRVSASFANVTVSGDNGDFARQHDVRGALDAIDQRLSATVKIVKLALGHGVVDVDCWDFEIAQFVHLVKIMHASGSFLGNTLDSRQKMGVFGVDEIGQVAAIVEDHVEWLTVGEEDGLLDAPDVLLVGLALPRVNGNSSFGDGRGGVVLGGEDVAAGPCDLGAQLDEGLDEDGRLDGHMETAGDASALQRLGWSVLGAHLHQARHLVLGHVDHFAAPLSLADVGHFVRKLGFGTHFYKLDLDSYCLGILSAFFDFFEI